MIIGLIGVGAVGGTLKKYFEQQGLHELRLCDPAKGYDDSFDGIDACFVSIPVVFDKWGQNIHPLRDAVESAKRFTDKVFIRSTVLPGTNDLLGCISMPEFLTERRAFEDMCELQILCGQLGSEIVPKIFPEKKIIFMSNKEAELAKFTHNCFGAVKVTYFNIMAELAKKIGADFAKVKEGASITGFIEKHHTQVPGPDGKHGYGGKCFPENMGAMLGFLNSIHHESAAQFFEKVISLNALYRD